MNTASYRFPPDDRVPAGVPVAGGTVAAAMISSPKVLPATATVARVRDDFQDDHVHCVLIVKGDVLLAVVEPTDIVGAGPEELAVSLGRLPGRTIGPDENLEPVRVSMVRQRRRRLAVVDGREALLGLLCLKRTGLGFCSDADVGARAAEREGQGPASRLRQPPRDLHQLACVPRLGIRPPTVRSVPSLSVIPGSVPPAARSISMSSDALRKL